MERFRQNINIEESPSELLESIPTVAGIADSPTVFTAIKSIRLTILVAIPIVMLVTNCVYKE